MLGAVDDACVTRPGCTAKTSRETPPVHNARLPASPWNSPMSDPRRCLVLNGKSAGRADLRDAVATVRGRGVTVDVRVTWEEGDATRHVDEAVAAGVDTIVAGGGDGTLREVVAALARRIEPSEGLPTLGLVAMGTANDFATAAGLPDTPIAALDLVAAEAAVAIDVLHAEADGDTWWAANLASGGFGTQVTVETPEGMKKLLGGLAYLLTGLSKLGRIEPIEAILRGPDFHWAGGFIALGIGNGRQAGGGQVLCPDASIRDGLLDVTVIPALTGEVAATLGAVISEGKLAALDRVATRAQLPWLEVEAKAPLVLNLDGEPVESARFRIECVPRRLRMHLPADCPLLS